MTNQKEKIESLAEVNPDVLIPDGMEQAIIGWVEIAGMPPIAALDVTRCLAVLIEQGMDQDEAVEYLQYNVTGAYLGENTPAFVHLFEEEIDAEIE